MEIKSARFFSIFHLISFVIVAGAVVLFVNLQQKQIALSEAREKTKIVLEHNLAIHTYFSKQLKPSVFSLSDEHRGAGYFDPVWMSSTFAVREIDKYYKALSTDDYAYKECAVNARSPENEADPYERGFIEESQKDPHLTQRAVVRTINGSPYFVMMRRGETMEADCLRCHSIPAAAPEELVGRYGASRSFGRRTGELVSAISIRIPLKKAYDAANTFSVELSGVLLAILSLIYLFQYLVAYRLYLKPVDALRGRMQTLMDDESRLGESAGVHSLSKEVNDLTRSFDSLSRQLREERDGLVAQVESRTAELTEKVALLEATLSRMKKLEGIIRICGECKKICDGEESWHQLERYISDHSDALFSHGLCPDCYLATMKKLGLTPSLKTKAPDDE